MRNSLGRIDRRAAADGEHEIDALAPRKLDALIDERVARIGLDASELDVRDALRLQRRLNAADQARPNRRAAAIVDQHLRAAERADLAPNLVFRTAPKHKLRGHLISKILHASPPFRASPRAPACENRSIRQRCPAACRSLLPTL